MESKTKTNLLRAFAGECQARMRYEIAAKIAGKNDLAIIQDIFISLLTKKKNMLLFFTII